MPKLSTNVQYTVPESRTYHTLFPILFNMLYPAVRLVIFSQVIFACRPKQEPFFKFANSAFLSRLLTWYVSVSDYMYTVMLSLYCKLESIIGVLVHKAEDLRGNPKT